MKKTYSEPEILISEDIYFVTVTQSVKNRLETGGSFLLSPKLF